MKHIEAIVFSCVFLFAVVGQSSSANSMTPAGQVQQRSSQESNGRSLNMGEMAAPSSTARAPMADTNRQVKELSAALSLTENQQNKLRLILQSQQEQTQAVVYDRSLSQEQRMAKFRTLGDSLAAKIRALLNDDQRKKFDLTTGKANTDSGATDGNRKPLPESTTSLVPKLGTNLRAGSYKFQVRFDNGGVEQSMTLSTTIREDNDAWIATEVVDAPNGESTDMSVLAKDSLILRKRSLHQGSVSVSLDFAGNKAEGSLNINGIQQPITADLGGPLFADAAGWEEVVACLPLSTGYTTTFRNFDLQKHKSKLIDLKVAGTETVTVPAGTFKAFRVELASKDGGPEKSTVWITSDSRMPVKIFAVLGSMGRATMNAELLQ